MIPLPLGRDGALGRIVSAYVIWNRFDLPYESSSFSRTGQCLVTCACPRIYQEQMITLLSMEMPYTSATIQGLDFETDSRQLTCRNEFAPETYKFPCHAMHQIVPGRSPKKKCLEIRGRARRLPCSAEIVVKIFVRFNGSHEVVVSKWYALGCCESVSHTDCVLDLDMEVSQTEHVEDAWTSYLSSIKLPPAKIIQLLRRELGPFSRR